MLATLMKNETFRHISNFAASQVDIHALQTALVLKIQAKQINTKPSIINIIYNNHKNDTTCTAA